MNKREADFFRQLLTQRRRELLSGKTIEAIDGEEHFADPTDRASLEADRNFILRIRDRERRLLIKIEEALSRLDKGVYGICEACGDEIDIARLKARPVTTLCIQCKSSQEVEEKKNRRLL